MSSDTTYVQKFAQLSPFYSQIFATVKKDCKSEHLAIDNKFFKAHFPGKNLAKLTTEELLEVYPKIIQDGHEALAEFVANRWLLKRMEIYSFFEEELKTINPQFDQILEIPLDHAQEMLVRADSEFHPADCYIFCVFNSVAFPESIYEALKKKAELHVRNYRAPKVEEKETQNPHDLQNEMNKVIARYEKKLSGMQKKYLNDMTSLKKQIAQLQRKLASEKNECCK